MPDIPSGPAPVLRVLHPQTMSELWHQRLGHVLTQLAHLQHHATGLPAPKQIHTLIRCVTMLAYKSIPLVLSNLLPTFALARDFTLNLVLYEPHPRRTNARKARTAVSFYRMSATMRTALSPMHAADIPDAS
jgi:hypothetical protein